MDVPCRPCTRPLYVSSIPSSFTHRIVPIENRASMDRNRLADIGRGSSSSHIHKQCAASKMVSWEYWLQTSRKFSRSLSDAKDSTIESVSFGISSTIGGDSATIMSPPVIIVPDSRLDQTLQTLPACRL
mmetsp:Transcript_8923/g.20757  ORF Transcript_8923/g.20757 Transcript_8923/m.20757 type:complete len:129 (-) Transcript_8923:11-397(-)